MMRLFVLFSLLTLMLAGCIEPVSNYGRPVVQIDNESSQFNAESESERRSSQRT